MVGPIVDLVTRAVFSTGVPRNPRVPPAQSRGSARSYTNATSDTIFEISNAGVGAGVPRSTGMHPWGSAPPKRLKNTVLENV